MLNQRCIFKMLRLSTTQTIILTLFVISLHATSSNNRFVKNANANKRTNSVQNTNPNPSVWSGTDQGPHLERDDKEERRILYRNTGPVVRTDGVDEMKNFTDWRRTRRSVDEGEGGMRAGGGAPYDVEGGEYGQGRFEDYGLEQNGNCSDCTSVREIKRSYRMVSIKQEILRKLRLSGPPNVAGLVRPSIPHVERLIAQLNEEASRGLFGDESEAVDDYHATPMSVILFAQPAPPEVGGSDPQICWFPLRQEALRHEIVNATLGIFIRNTSAHSAPFETYLLVHRLGALSSGGSPAGRIRVQFRKIRLGEGGDGGRWVEIDFKAVLSRLISRREKFYGIQVEAWDERGGQVAVVMPRGDEETLYRPYLEIHVKETSSSRPKRTPERLCEEAGAERSCCRYPLLVDFREFGWDFVIVPRSYSAYYCSGECPYLFMQRHSHSRITQEARRDGGAPCCTPRKVSAISMIYYDDRMNIVYSKLPGMVVDSCGCS